MLRFFPILMVLFLSLGCSLRAITVDMTGDILVEGAVAVEEEEDLELAEVAISANIKMIDGLLKSSPTNKQLLVFASRSYGGFSFAFMEDRYHAFKEDSPRKSRHFKKRAERFYIRGKNYGLKVLKMDSGFHDAMTKDFDTFEKALLNFDTDDVAALFWTAYNWGNWINLNLQSPQAVADAPRMERMMNRVLALDEAFFFGGPHLFYGAYFGSRPKMLGGDLKKSKKHFERALALNKRKFLITQILYAQYFAVQSQDEKLFTKLLREVINAPDNIFPEQSLITQLAKKKARQLLRKREDLF